MTLMPAHSKSLWPRGEDVLKTSELAGAEMSLRTLIVDDEPIARKVLREELECLAGIEIVGGERKRGAGRSKYSQRADQCRSCAQDERPQQRPRIYCKQAASATCKAAFELVAAWLKCLRTAC